ncbi:phosphopantetheine-binding protein [Saccharopolyspora phatthalungensis]|uniref:Aryl carrier-like protein n=1 Tax=Saccharopolyspora phatthalungensis TaxID=664693 RepID=A0A840QDW1_9PSEU|nr:phosphopantetheine-binding protein [Saccharopolyspora phatthalungensis]MBB5158974.1 aryl carrier-like protein [Saccharopolyspora phatthalungensis]
MSISEAELRDTVAAVLGMRPDEIAGDANLVQLGLSSLETMRLASRWRRERRQVSFAALVGQPTLNQWLDHLNGR